jgi:hypothetical protein
VEHCDICAREGEDIGVVSCANCEKSACGDCFLAQGGGAYGRSFPICKECQKVLTVCKECSSYVPNEYISECPTCKSMICEDCLEEHMTECGE